MNMQKIENNRWIFPENISFESVPEYSEYFAQLDHSDSITFDLSQTVSIHSAFIGFLINAKKVMQRGNGTLTLRLSNTAERLFQMLNIIKYFSTEPAQVADRKTA
jgi:anti-anti-sigma regulatory factor